MIFHLNVFMEPYKIVSSLQNSILNDREQSPYDDEFVTERIRETLTKFNGSRPFIFISQNREAPGLKK